LGKPLWLGLLSLLTASIPAAAAEPASDLLQAHGSKIENCSDPWTSMAEIHALVDGDTATACLIRAQKDLPTDFLCSFSGAVVSPESVQLQLAVSGESNEVLGQVEIFGSIVSPQVGFQLLRKDILRATRAPQIFTFPPTGAKWVILRFLRPSSGGDDLSVADLKLPGHPGPPVSHYAFLEAPAQALQVLAKISPVVAGDVAVTPVETALFQDVKDGRLQSWPLADGLLLASGILAVSERRAYLAKLDRLEQAAQKSLAGIADPFKRGAGLLNFLHTTTLRQYRYDQLDWPLALDKHIFNCVSATTLYNLAGQKLGLDVRSVEAPDHVFAILYHGLEHADVETTTPMGFNPARDPEAVLRFAATTGFTYLPENAKDQRREITNAGLIGIVYCARGARLAHEHKYAQALRAYFCALSLDHEMTSAIHNILALLSGWSIALALEGKLPEAVAIAQTGLAIAPRDQSLNFTHRALCVQQANDALDAGDPAKALAIFRHAAQVAPTGDFEKLQAWVFIRPAQKFAANGEWTRALQAAELGRSQVPRPAQAELDTWRASVYNNWAEYELDKLHYAQAAQVLEEAMRVLPSEKRFSYLLGYVVQTWTESVWQTKDFKSAGAILLTMLRRHPHLPQIKLAFAGLARRLLEHSLESVFRAEVLVPLVSARSLPWGHEKLELVIRLFLDALAQAHLRHNDWNEAEKIYRRALELFPEDETLQNNLMGVWDRRIDAARWSENWEAALSYADAASHEGLDNKYFEEKLGEYVFERAEMLYGKRGRLAAEGWLGRAVETYPNNPYVPEAVEDYLQNRLAEISPDDPKRDFKIAELTNRCRVLRVDKYTPQKLEIRQYDELAAKYLRRKNWESALRVYRDALRFYPDEDHVRTSAVEIWDAWFQDCLARKDWETALAVSQRAGQQLPYNLPHFDGCFQNAVELYALSEFNSGGVAQSSRTLASLFKQYPFKPCLRLGAFNHFQNLLENADSRNLTALETFGLGVMREAVNAFGDQQVGEALARVLYQRLAGEANQRGDAKAAGNYYAAAMKKGSGAGDRLR
jgi:tetratricopeptide (TPR) repeat protein